MAAARQLGTLAPLLKHDIRDADAEVCLSDLSHREPLTRIRPWVTRLLCPLFFAQGPDITAIVAVA